MVLKRYFDAVWFDIFQSIFLHVDRITEDIEGEEEDSVASATDQRSAFIAVLNNRIYNIATATTAIALLIICILKLEVPLRCSAGHSKELQWNRLSNLSDLPLDLQR